MQRAGGAAQVPRRAPDLNRWLAERHLLPVLDAGEEDNGGAARHHLIVIAHAACVLDGTRCRAYSPATT
ncbi:MAG: hypothetical protein U5K36_03995 [Roseovarius sp.]|nr:hypothetical protein [Roseovarius sp.]